MEDVVVTVHGAQRTKERIGLSKKLAKKNAAKALEFGLSHSETKGMLKRYVDKLYFRGENINNIRIYHRCVYMFRDIKLITVIPLPRNLWTLADKLQKKKDDGE